MSSPCKRWLVALSVVLALGGGAHAQDVRIFNGHFNSVRSVAFSPDGKTLASSGFDNTARIWDVKTGTALRQMNQINWVMHTTFSPDGKVLATCNYSRQVSLYDPTTGALLRTYMGHPGAVNMCAFSPDGKLVASVAAERNLRVWDATTTIEKFSALADDNFNLFAVAFSPDGKTVAAAGQDRTIRLFDLSGRELQRLRGHTDLVAALAFSPDGRMLISGSHDRTVRLWELSTGRERLALAGHTNWVRSVAVSADGRTIASGGYDNTIRLWGALSGKELKKLAGHTSFVWSVGFSPDSKSLASGSEDRTVRVWKVSDITERKAMKAEKLTAKDLAVCWNDLTSEDGPKAYKAVSDLTSSPEESLAYFKDVLKPVRDLDGEARKRVDKLIAELDDADYATRKRAMSALASLGSPIAPQMRKALTDATDVDLRLRLFVVLRTLDKVGASPEQMRILRALEVMERVGTNEAKEVLQELAGGVPDAFLTNEARAALARVTARMAKR